MKRRKLKVKKLAVFLLIEMCIFSFLSFNAFSLAKYIAQDTKKALVIPATFQFSSDYLKEDDPAYNVYDWNGGISIELYNSLNINKSEIDIPYTVTVTNGNYTLSDGTNNITCTNNVCTFLVSEDKHIINVTPINTANPVIVSVASQTYDYTLSAVFNLKDAGNNSYYTFANKNEYYELTIYTSNNDINSLTINWNSNYAPDNTNSIMESWTGNSGTLSLSKNTQYKLIFFKNTNTAYSNVTNTIIQNNAITLP